MEATLLILFLCVITGWQIAKPFRAIARNLLTPKNASKRARGF